MSRILSSAPRGRSLRRRIMLGIFALSCAFLFAARASLADEFSQVSSQSIQLVRGTVVIDTRVGDIYIEGWDKERVQVQAEKVVRAGSGKKSRHLFGRLHVQLSTDEEERTVYLKTLYPARRPWRRADCADSRRVSFRGASIS